MSDNGYVNSKLENGVATITFFHPKSNSLPAAILASIAKAVEKAGKDGNARCVVLRSDGERAFCAGASFDELLAIENFEQGREFFMGFARLILAMRSCPKIILCRVHGKTVGGGVGVAAAADYTLAVEGASAKLSEIALGIGPFVVGPAVKRKIGLSAFSAMAMDSNWRDAHWCKDRGLYSDVFPTVGSLDKALGAMAEKFARQSPEAMAKLKSVFFEGTEDWPGLLEKRAEMSGRLVLSDFTREYIQQFKQKG